MSLALTPYCGELLAFRRARGSLFTSQKSLGLKLGLKPSITK